MTHTTTPALTFGQAAARLGIDVTTVRRWVRTEACPTVRVGNARRIPAEFVDGLIAQGSPVAPTAAPATCAPCKSSSGTPASPPPSATPPWTTTRSGPR
jgi:excisionase family DNA binding protein